MSAEEEPQWWRRQGYLAGKPIEGGLWICLAPMAFTFRLMVCDEWGVSEFWCYPELATALGAFEAFAGEGDPIDGWVKHHPSQRRRTLA